MVLLIVMMETDKTETDLLGTPVEEVGVLLAFRQEAEEGMEMAGTETENVGITEDLGVEVDHRTVVMVMVAMTLMRMMMKMKGSSEE